MGIVHDDQQYISHKVGVEVVQAHRNRVADLPGSVLLYGCQQGWKRPGIIAAACYQAVDHLMADPPVRVGETGEKLLRGVHGLSRSAGGSPHLTVLVKARVIVMEDRNGTDRAHPEHVALVLWRQVRHGFSIVGRRSQPAMDPSSTLAIAGFAASPINGHG